MLINQKTRACRRVDFAIPSDYRGEMKESEKRKYLHLACGT